MGLGSRHRLDQVTARTMHLLMEAFVHFLAEHKYFYRSYF